MPPGTANQNTTTRSPRLPDPSDAPTAASPGTDTPNGREGRLRRFYLLGLKIKQMETERNRLREIIVATHGTGSHSVGAWLATINSFTVNRLDRAAAEAELGSLARFEKPTASLRVEVKPSPTAILGAI